MRLGWRSLSGHKSYPSRSRRQARATTTILFPKRTPRGGEGGIGIGGYISGMGKILAVMMCHQSPSRRWGAGVPANIQVHPFPAIVEFSRCAEA